MVEANGYLFHETLPEGIIVFKDLQENLDPTNSWVETKNSRYNHHYYLQHEPVDMQKKSAANTKYWKQAQLQSTWMNSSVWLDF